MIANRNSTARDVGPYRAMAQKGNLNGVQFLIIEGVDIDDPDDQLKRTALILSALNGHSDVVCYLSNQSAHPRRTELERAAAWITATSEPSSRTQMSSK